MKILYYLPSLYPAGGLERIIIFKANYFATHFPDYEVVIMTSEQRGKPTFYPLSDQVKHIDLDVSIDYPFDQSLLKKFFLFPFRYSTFKKRFIKAIEQEKPDIVISTIRREINFLPLLRDGSFKIAELHVTKEFYRPNFDSNLNNWLQQQRDRSRASKLKMMDAVVFLTHQEKYLWPELQHVHVIPNPLVFSATTISSCTAKQVIAVGRYVPQKGFDLLIAAWAIVHGRHPDWVLKIYGEGTGVDLQGQIDRLALSDVCTLRPTTSAIEEKYGESSIFVLSSRYEGFGMVLAEAMSCGLPTVAFNCPSGPSEIIKHEVDGFLVDNGHIAQLADRICQLIEDEALRKEMGMRAKENSARFHMQNIALQWKELFDTSNQTFK